MKKTAVAIILLVLAIFGLYFYFVSNRLVNNQIQRHHKIGDIVEFTGVLEDFDAGCSVDAACIAYVDNKLVVTHPGDVEVQALGTFDIWTDNIGSSVEVRAVKTGNNKYTLVGDSTLYLKVLSKSCDFVAYDDSLTIDFSLCEACQGATYVGFGSTHYKFYGVQNDFCQFNYGTEIENPSGYGDMSINCLVPLTVGKTKFPINNYGVDFSSINNYCDTKL